MNNSTLSQKTERKNYLVIIIGALIAVTMSLVLTNSFKLAFVNGNSMNPTICNGDIVLVSAYSQPEDQDIIILDTQGTSITTNSIIKRYYEDKSDATSVWVEGDNKDHSLDSRILGTFDKDRVIGVALFDFSQFKVLK